VGKEQCLGPFAFLNAVFPFVDDVLKKMFFIRCQSYFVFLLWHKIPPYWFLCPSA
jgi:hypothetical protein